MSDLIARLAELTAAASAAVAGSDLERKGLVLVTNDGREVDTMQDWTAGAIVIYPLPGVEYPSPKVQRVTWTYAVLSGDPDPVAASARIQDITALLYTAGIIRWEDRATPTDFKRGDQNAPVTVPGYSITHTEEHRS